MEKLKTKPWCPAVVGAKEAAIKFRGATGVPQIQWTLRALLGSPVAATRFLRASKIGASGGRCWPRCVKSSRWAVKPGHQQNWWRSMISLVQLKSTSSSSPNCFKSVKSRHHFTALTSLISRSREVSWERHFQFSNSCFQSFLLSKCLNISAINIFPFQVKTWPKLPVDLHVFWITRLGLFCLLLKVQNVYTSNCYLECYGSFMR